MRALVLGGNGFIGSHIVDRLLTQGHFVRVFDRGVDKYRAPLKGVDYRLASFDDVPALAEALEGIDVVFHLISTTVPSTSNKDPIFDIESNLIGTVRLLNLMKDSNVSRIVYLSSGGTVYGIPENSPIKESDPLQPICSYGVVKVATENYLQMFNHLYGIKHVILRVSNPYGERQGHTGVQGVIGTFMGKVLAEEQIEIWGDGSVVRDFIYVEDLAKLCITAATSSVTGIFNSGSGEGYSIKEIVEALSTVSGIEVNPKYLPGRSYDVPHVVLDISKAKEQLKWEAGVSLGEGMARTWGWINKLL